MTEKELWKLIKSNDYKVWSIAKHRSAVALTEIVEDKEALNEIEEDLRDEQSSLLGISSTTWAKVGFSILKL